MNKWEYTTLMVRNMSDIDNTANGYGSEGWELVSMTSNDTGYFFLIFKRQIN